MSARYTTYNLDCRDVMDLYMDENSVDAIVTDPPYGLSFMGKAWDHGVPGVEFWARALRVLKPGGHLLAFGGSRTYHRMASAVEDAGFEIRDQIMWVYGSGFPKSLDVSKAIDKAAGAEREVVGKSSRHVGKKTQRLEGLNGTSTFAETPGMGAYITAPATEAARQWQGFGTALKPAHEPIVVARKPLIGTVAANVLAHGTGVLNIDGCRVGVDDDRNGGRYSDNKQGDDGNIYGRGINERSANDYVQPAGRWPANLIHDGGDEVLAGFPVTKSGEGSAARFFYCAKGSKSDRGADNTHPTVKPTDLMAYLCRLVTPPGGTVLDPFMGSGKAALREGFKFIGCELDAAYHNIAKGRLRAESEASLKAAA